MMNHLCHYRLTQVKMSHCWKNHNPPSQIYVSQHSLWRRIIILIKHKILPGIFNVAICSFFPLQVLNKTLSRYLWVPARCKVYPWWCKSTVNKGYFENYWGTIFYESMSPYYTFEVVDFHCTVDQRPKTENKAD